MINCRIERTTSQEMSGNNAKEKHPSFVSIKFGVRRSVQPPKSGTPNFSKSVRYFCDSIKDAKGEM